MSSESAMPDGQHEALIEDVNEETNFETQPAIPEETSDKHLAP